MSGAGKHVAVRLKKGGTIWGIAIDQIRRAGNSDPSNQTIVAKMKHLMRLNDVRNDRQARHLAAGTEIQGS